MESDVISTRFMNNNFFRKVQILLMCICVGWYAAVSVYLFSIEDPYTIKKSNATTTECPDRRTSYQSKPKTYHIVKIIRHIACALILFSIFTFVYLVELRSKIHGKIVACYLSTLGIHIVMATLDDSYNYCFGQIFLIFPISCYYYWMTCVCFELWLTFSRPVDIIRQISSENLKLIAFCLYSWALPSLLFVLNYYKLYNNGGKQEMTDEEMQALATGRIVQAAIYLQITLHVVTLISTWANIRFFHSDTRFWDWGINPCLIVGLSDFLACFTFDSENMTSDSLVRLVWQVYAIALAVYLLYIERVFKLYRVKRPTGASSRKKQTNSKTKSDREPLDELSSTNQGLLDVCSRYGLLPVLPVHLVMGQACSKAPAVEETAV